MASRAYSPTCTPRTGSPSSTHWVPPALTLYLTLYLTVYLTVYLTLYLPYTKPYTPPFTLTSWSRHLALAPTAARCSLIALTSTI